jgi:Mce-associated membrane protein
VAVTSLTTRLSWSEGPVASWRRNPLLATSGTLLAIAVVFAVWAGTSWLTAPRAAAGATTRDQALREGEQAVLNFNTLSYRTVKSGVQLWEQSSTGTLHSQIATGQSAFEQQIEQAKSVTTAKILDAALTALNARAGTATIIVALEITVTPEHGAAATKQSRQEGVLTMTPSGWKLSSLEQVPVGAANSSGSKG